MYICELSAVNSSNLDILDLRGAPSMKKLRKHPYSLWYCASDMVMCGKFDSFHALCACEDFARSFLMHMRCAV